MRVGGRQVLSWVAIFAIALHTVLWGVAAPMAAGSAADPFTVICHSGAQAAAPADQSPAGPKSTPGSACDHCNLCSAVPSVLGTLDSVVAGYLTPAKLLHVVPSSPAVPRDGVASNPKLARGPPAKT